MTARLELAWRPESGGAEFFALGDVRDVIYSRAERSMTLPVGATHGFGLLSATGPAGAGEGMLLRGLPALTEPTSKAGVLITSSVNTSSWKTPFFLAWSGMPSAVGRILGSPSVSVRRIYESVFEWLERACDGGAPPLVFLEIWGLFAMEEIHDRALQLPVHQGGVLITAVDQSPSYFRFGAIREDLREHFPTPDRLLPLAVLGVGFRPAGTWRDEERFAKAVFYEPPTAGREQEVTASSPLRTHSHAFGWRDQPALVEQLLRILDSADFETPRQRMEEDLLPDLLQRSPDYLVHLDDWSCAKGGLVRVFLPDSPDGLRFLEPA